MNDRLDATERFWLIVFGVGLILLVLTGSTSMGEYPKGSLRNEPIYWVVFSGIGVAFGALVALNGVRGGRRVRRHLMWPAGLGRDRLRDALDYARRVDLPPVVVEQRVRDAIDRGTPIPPPSSSRSRQSMAGTVDGGQITLVVHDANIVTRRKSWNVTFEGVVALDGGGTVVRGTVDIPDREQLDQLVLLFRIGSAAPVLVVGGLAIRGWMTYGTLALGEVLPAVSISIVACAVTIWLRIDGEAAAAADAASVVRFLDEILTRPV